MRNNSLKDKSYGFAILIVKNLRQDKKEFVLSKQILRSGTVIGAFIRKAAFGGHWIDPC